MRKIRKIVVAVILVLLMQFILINDEVKATDENLKEQNELKEGIYKIVLATAPTQSLTVDGGKTFNGANIHIWNYVNSPQQQFKIKYDNDGYCEIIPVHSNKRIDVVGWGNEANVDQWEYNGRK